MSDTLSKSLRSIDRQYLHSNSNAHDRYTCVLRKTRLIDVERENNPYLNKILLDQNPNKLREDFDNLRKERFGGIAKKILPQKFNPAFNENVDKLSTIIENVDYLYTKEITRQPAIVLASLSPLAGAIIGTYIQSNPEEWANYNPVKTAMATTFLGLATATTVHHLSRNRNSNEIRPWNSIAYVQANLHHYKAAADIIRPGSFDDAQHSSRVINWEYYNEQLHLMPTTPGVHPSIFNPTFKETIATKLYVLADQIKAEVESAIMSDDTQSL